VAPLAVICASGLLRGVSLRPLQSVEQSASVRIIADNPPPGIARRHHVIDGTLELDPKSPCHAPESEAVNELIIQAKTKTNSDSTPIGKTAGASASRKNQAGSAARCEFRFPFLVAFAAFIGLMRATAA
jgi:hypothetical protein